MKELLNEETARKLLMNVLHARSLKWSALIHFPIFFLMVVLTCIDPHHGFGLVLLSTFPMSLLVLMVLGGLHLIPDKPFAASLAGVCVGGWVQWTLVFYCVFNFKNWNKARVLLTLLGGIAGVALHSLLFAAIYLPTQTADPTLLTVHGMSLLFIEGFPTTAWLAAGSYFFNPSITIVQIFGLTSIQWGVAGAITFYILNRNGEGVEGMGTTRGR